MGGTTTDRGAELRESASRNGQRTYTAWYVPAVFDRAFGRIVRSPVGGPFRPWAPESSVLRATVFVLSVASVVLIRAVPVLGPVYAGAWIFLWTTSPSVGPWAWGYLTVDGLVSSDVEPSVTTGLATLFVLSVAYYLFVRGSSVDPYSSASTAGSAGPPDAAVDFSPTGGWYRDVAESERSQPRRLPSDAPVDLGDELQLEVRAVRERGETVRGRVEGFQVVVTTDVPSGVETCDELVVQITAYATIEKGRRNAAIARYLRHCDRD